MEQGSLGGVEELAVVWFTSSWLLLDNKRQHGRPGHGTGRGSLRGWCSRVASAQAPQVVALQRRQSWRWWRPPADGPVVDGENLLVSHFRAWTCKSTLMESVQHSQVVKINL